MTFKTRKTISQMQSLIFDLVESMNESDPDASAKKGSENRTTTKREVGDFNEVKITSTTKVGVEVKIVIGEQYDVEIEIDDNLQDDIGVDIMNKRLTIKNLGKYRSKKGLVINVKTKSLESINTEGEVSTRVQNFNNDMLSARISGLSQLTIEGRVSRGKIESNGSSSNIDLSKLLAKEAELKINGSGNAYIHVTERLNVTINGTGNVRYTGNPPSVTKEIRGMGYVIPEEGK